MDSRNSPARDWSNASIASSLLLRVRQHEPDAWSRLVRIYGPVVYHWCARAGLRGQEAADIGQEVFRAVADGIANFRRERSGDTFVGWLRSITRFKIADYHRGRNNVPDAVGGTDFQIQVAQLEQSPEDVDEQAELNQARSLLFHRALQIIETEFEQRTWQAFWATAVDERPTADVAADLGMTPVAVRKAKSRVLRRLRDEFDEEFA